MAVSRMMPGWRENVGGRRIAEPTEITSGDVITVGSLSFTLKKDEPLTTTLPAPA